MYGTIARVYADKGFGFIKGEDGKDYFFHHSAIERPLKFEELAGGDEVEFEDTRSSKGLRAEQVTSRDR